MNQSPFPMEKKRLLGVVAVLSFGLSSLFAVLPLELLDALIAPTFVLGFFIVLPLLAIFGDDLDVVANEDEAAAESAVNGTDPVDRLRERYADGELSEEEFERKLDLLLRTEDLDARTAEREPEPSLEVE